MKSRLVSAGGATYTYDALGQRVSKSGVGVTDTVYFGGQPIARYAGGQWTDLIYGPTGLLAEVPGTQTGAPVYRVTDHLGSTVGSLLADGSFVNPMDYTPFGQVFAGSTSDPYKFTGYERDAESGLDYASARQYASNIGRFISPDPSGLASADMTNPQSLNLYAYVMNNPINNVDPTGMYCAYSDGSSEKDEDHGGVGEDDCNQTGGHWTDDSNPCDNAAAGSGCVATFDWDKLATFDAFMADDGISFVQTDVPSVDGLTYGPLAAGHHCPSEPLQIPLVVSSPYGQRGSEFHPGVDYSAPVGTPVYSAESGTVARAYSSSSAGNVIVVQNPFGGDSIYMHLSRFTISQGQSVNAGVRIGASGNTGHSTGPHLHFEQHTPGSIYDSSGHFNHATRTSPCD